MLMSHPNPFLKYDNELIRLCFSRMDYDFCKYCGLYIHLIDFSKDKREIIKCIEAECPSLKRECEKRNPYYEAKKKIESQKSDEKIGSLNG